MLQTINVRYFSNEIDKLAIEQIWNSNEILSSINLNSWSATWWNPSDSLWTFVRQSDSKLIFLFMALPMKLKAFLVLFCFFLATPEMVYDHLIAIFVALLLCYETTLESTYFINYEDYEVTAMQDPATDRSSDAGPKACLQILPETAVVHWAHCTTRLTEPQEGMKIWGWGQQ